MQLTLRQFEVFLAVAKAASFRVAAEAMHLSQPALSQHVAEMERELGARLFDRLGRKPLIVGVYPRVPVDHDLLRGWVGMVGIVFVLHFGIFHLLSLAWQTLGVSAKPIMDWPIKATSVSEFWGQRWNLAFRDLTHRFLFRPLTARFGAWASSACILRKTPPVCCIAAPTLSWT